MTDKWVMVFVILGSFSAGIILGLGIAEEPETVYIRLDPDKRDPCAEGTADPEDCYRGLQPEQEPDP